MVLLLLLLLREKRHEALNLVFGDRPLPQAVARSASASKYPILDMVEMSILPLPSNNTQTIRIPHPSPPPIIYIGIHTLAHRSCFLPATGWRKGVEGGKGKHLSPVRHLLPETTGK